MNTTGFGFHWLCDIYSKSRSLGNRMFEPNCAINDNSRSSTYCIQANYSRYEKIWQKILCWMFCSLLIFSSLTPPRWPSGKASTSRAEDPRFESRLRPDFFGVDPYQWLNNWHFSGYPARCLALQGQCWDWSAWCQYIVTGWDRKFDLQLLSQCGST